MIAIHFADNATAPILVRLIEEAAMPVDLDAVVAQGARASRFSGKAGQLFECFVDQGGTVVRMVLVGCGLPADGQRIAHLEKAGAAISAKYASCGEKQLALDMARASLTADDAAAVLLGLRLRAWRWQAWRSKVPEDQKLSLAEVIVIGAPAGSEAAWQREAAIAEGIELTRELVTEPGNVIYPETFVERVQQRVADSGLLVRVLDDAEMRRLGMGALLGVAQGSVRPPRLLVLEWRGAGGAPTALVGKGVTFDTGGISLKPPAGMEDMKWDMGGAGAVVGAMLALARRGSQAHVIGLCGLVENMPDGAAQRPGDVVTSMSGQTIEVINTDAEGRLVLCDVLTFAQREYAPCAIIDLATLTGAIIASLAHEYGGLFSNDDDLAARLIAAGKTSGDRLWQMPMGPAYDKMIDSPIADMKNIGGKFGGSITAAQFLARFVEKNIPWAHLDIAGMVWADKAGATWDKGATGYGVRLLDRYVRDVLET